MVHLFTETSKYLMILLFIIYTCCSFAVLPMQDERSRRRMYRAQVACMILIHLDAFCVLFAAQREVRYLVFYAAQVLFVLFFYFIYRVIYKKSSRMVVNHMCMLMLIGFIILTRLDFTSAIRQFEVAVAASIVTIFIPQLVRKLKFLKKFTWVYCVAGIVALGAVLAVGRMTGGAYLSFTVAGITVQPSEFVKIIFVFFVACMFYRSTSFKQICITTVAAAIHVAILVVSTDLGAALIFFITYVVMLYVATRRPVYLAGGLGIGCLAAWGAARVFSHVQTRVSAWRDPFANISGGGWQVAQSLFAIGTGSWFGLGLYQGMPDKVPVVDSDFIFAAIAEEMGEIFGICLIFVCLSCFLIFLTIAMQISDPFYKLIALGLGCVYGIQVFLNIGGVIKLIPSTGLTLPLVSYGGSSILCTIIMFAIIQGLYIFRQDEGESHEKEQSGQEPEQSRAQDVGGGYRGDQPGEYPGGGDEPGWTGGERSRPGEYSRTEEYSRRAERGRSEKRGEKPSGHTDEIGDLW